MSELKKLEKIAEDQRDKNARIEGKLETLYEELEEEGFSSLEKAEKESETISSKINKMRKTFQLKLKKFKEENADKIQNAN